MEIQIRDFDLNHYHEPLILVGCANSVTER